MSIPGSASPLFLASTAAAGAYDIPRSLRFNSADSAYLSQGTSRTPAANTSITFSFWLKLSNLSTDQQIIWSNPAAGFLYITYWGSYQNGALWVGNDASGQDSNTAKSNGVLRDPSAWYHIFYSRAHSSNGILYINGVEQTTQAINTANIDFFADSTRSIGRRSDTNSRYANFYLADFYCIDGQALTPSDFGEYDDSNVWQPKLFAGTYGTNGFHLDFSDTSSDSALGTDSSGAGNNWSVNNLSAAGSNWNQDYVWSDYWDSPMSGSTLRLAGFDGSTSSRSYDANTFSTWTSPVTLTVNTQLRIRSHTYTPGLAADKRVFEVNGTNYYSLLPAYAPGTVPWVVIPESTLTSIKISGYGNGYEGSVLGGIEIDGVELVDQGVFDSLAANIDALRDSPVNGDSANDTGAGGEITGNYCTWNPLYSNGTITNGNLDITCTLFATAHAATIFASSGKYYWEILLTNASTFRVGVCNTSGVSEDLGNTANTWSYLNDGRVYHNSVAASYGVSATNGDIINVALDFDSGKIWYGKNGTWMASGNPANGLNPSQTFTVGELLAPAVANGAYPSGNAGFTANFGARAFAHAAPTNFKALCTANLSDPLIADGSTAFDAALYTGNGSTQTISGLGFSPDLAWLKIRNQAGSHGLWDAIRGTSARLDSGSTGAEDSTVGVTAFNSDGFTVGGPYNSSSNTWVAWAWSAGDNSNHTYAVTVSNPGSGNKFYADGALQPTLTLAEGSTYKFDQSSGTNSTHPLRFSTTSDGTHGGGSEYTTGVTTSGTPGSAGAYTQIVIAASAPTLYAYCTAHSGMGFQINTSDTAGYTIPVGGDNSSLYNQSYAITSNITGNLPAVNHPLAQWFNGQRANKMEPSGSGSLDFTGVSALQNFSGTLQFAVSAYLGSTSMKFVINASTDNLTFTTNTLPNASGGFPSQLLTIPVTSLRTLDFTSISGQSTQFWGMYLDGKLLVDSTATPDNFPAISSRIQADPSKGFSIVSYTGNATIGATVSHGLNAPVELIIAKTLTQTYDWPVYIKPVGPGKAFYLNSTAAAANSTGIWGNIDPTSSVFTLGGDPQANYSGGSIIAYCFAPVAGYSLFSSYVGNSSAEGPFVFTGFRPAFILIRSTAGGNWYLYDSVREESNLTKNRLYPNITSVEDTGTANSMDIVSNGFKLRSSHGGINLSGQTFIFISFAEHPFKTARAR